MCRPRAPEVQPCAGGGGNSYTPHISTTASSTILKFSGHQRLSHVQGKVATLTHHTSQPQLHQHSLNFQGTRGSAMCRGRWQLLHTTHFSTTASSTLLKVSGHQRLSPVQGEVATLTHHTLLNHGHHYYIITTHQSFSCR